MQQMLNAQDLRKSFDGVPVLQGISLQVNQGEVLAIIGPSARAKAPCCGASPSWKQ